MRHVFLAILILCCAAFTPHSSIRTEYLANVIYAEAGGESVEAKIAVATVIWERSNWDPSNIHAVITVPKHFAPPKKEEVNEWNDCMHLAKLMYRGSFNPIMVKLQNDTSVYPDHFYHGEAPYWAKGKPYSKIGNLKFVRLAEDNL